jgi:hypothetical protein
MPKNSEVSFSCYMLKCANVNIYIIHKNVLNLCTMCICIRCMMRISISSYFVFLVVVGVDDFFMLRYFSSATSSRGLLLVVRTFYVPITSCFVKYSFRCFFLSFPILYFFFILLIVGESPCKSLYCIVLPSESTGEQL